MKRLRIVLSGVALVCIPLGLILMFLALTQGRTPPAKPALTETDPAKPVAGSGGAAGSSFPSTVAALSGQWTVVAGEGTYAGYRVDEVLLRGASTHTAVGRSPKVSGGFVIRDGAVTGGAIEADLTALSSDESRRDGTLRTRGLETDRFPTARLVLTGSTPIDRVPRAGEPLDLVLDGDLLLHGVTRPVRVPVRAQLLDLDGPVVEVVGSIPIALEEYAIERPDVAGMLTVSDHGEIEVGLRFRPTPAGANPTTGSTNASTRPTTSPRAPS